MFLLSAGQDDFYTNLYTKTHKPITLLFNAVIIHIYPPHTETPAIPPESTQQLTVLVC